MSVYINSLILYLLFWLVAGERASMTSKEMQSELERLARTSKEALDNAAAAATASTPTGEGEKK